MLLSLNWAKANDGWHRLRDVQTDHVDVVGVYMIWYVGNPGAVISVGQGNVGRQLSFEQNSRTLFSLAPAEHIHVSWAEVPASQRAGIARYLANVFEPRLGGQFPIASPVEVLAPWETHFEATVSVNETAETSAPVEAHEEIADEIAAAIEPAFAESAPMDAPLIDEAAILEQIAAPETEKPVQQADTGGAKPPLMPDTIDEIEEDPYLKAAGF